MRPEARPFAGDCFDLPSSRLIRLQPQHADAIAEQLAAMDPWLTLGYSRPVLHAYLLRDDPALHRYALECSGDLAGLLCVRHPWLFGPHFRNCSQYFPSIRGTELDGTSLTGWQTMLAPGCEICGSWLHPSIQGHAVSTVATDSSKSRRLPIWCSPALMNCCCARCCARQRSGNRLHALRAIALIHRLPIFLFMQLLVVLLRSTRLSDH